MTRILLVDDEKALVECLSSILNLEGGFDVTTASGVDDGLKHLRTEGVDVLLTDICLSDGRGCDLVDMMHQLQPEARAIVMTGDEPSRHRGSLGADRVLRKPFDPSELVELLREVVDGPGL